MEEVSRQVQLLMLVHLAGAKTEAIAMMTERNKFPNRGMLAGEHPGVPCGPDTIVERGGVPANSR